MASLDTADTALCINPSILHFPHLNTERPKTRPSTPAAPPSDESHTEHPGKPPDKRGRKLNQETTRRTIKKTISKARDDSITQSKYVIDSFRLTENESLVMLDLINLAKEDHRVPREYNHCEEEFWIDYANLMNWVYWLEE